MTTTTKEALEPCPFCGGKAILGMFNVWCANCEAQTRKAVDAEAVDIIKKWNSRISAPIVAPVVDDLQRRLYEECVTANWDPERKNTFAEEIAHLHEELSEAFRAWRRYKDCEAREVNGKLEGVPIEFADVLIGMFYNAELYGFDLLAAVERKHQFNLNRNYVTEGRQLHAPAPASTVAPQQSQCLHQCDYGGMPRCSLPAGHEGTHDYTNAPASPAAPISSEAWTEWFNRLGAKASAEVVNATADLVTNERLAALVQAKVLPDPAALRDEAQVERHDILGALNHSRTICLHNAQDQSKSSEYRLMMEHFAEAGRQIIEMITEGRHKNLSRLVLE